MASLALHLVHAADVITLVVCAGVLTLLIVQRGAASGPQTEQAHARHRVRHPRPWAASSRPWAASSPSRWPATSTITTLPGWPDVLARLRRAAGRRAAGSPSRPHRPLRLRQPACRRPQPDRGGAVPADPARGRPPALLGPRRGGPAGRRAAGPRHRAAPRHRARSTTSRCATTSSGSSTATRSSPTPSSAASAWSRPTPSDRSPSGPTSGTRSAATSTATAGASASWAPARSGCPPTRRRACASSTSATRPSSTHGRSRSRAGR